MRNLFKKFCKDAGGATAIEYGLIAALIAVSMIVGATTVGTKVEATFECVGQRVQRAQQNKADRRFKNCVKRESK